MALKKKKATQKKRAIKLTEFPKRVLFRPDRYKYIKGKEFKETCVFCDASKHGVGFESLCVYKTKHSMLILNKFPYNPGHLLILPQSHKGNFAELSKDEYADLMGLVRTATEAMEEVYTPQGINLGLNQGRAAGAGIPDHLHFHLIPRWKGDLNFFPLIAETKVVVETLEQTYERFSKYFKGRGPA